MTLSKFKLLAGYFKYFLLYISDRLFSTIVWIQAGDTDRWTDSSERLIINQNLMKASHKYAISCAISEIVLNIFAFMRSSLCHNCLNMHNPLYLLIGEHTATATKRGILKQYHWLGELLRFYFLKIIICNYAVLKNYSSCKYTLIFV